MKLTRILDKRKNRRLALALMVMGVLTLGLMLITIWYYTSESYMAMDGEAEITVGRNAWFQDPGVKAKISGRDVSDRVKVESDLDLSRPGVYEITYSAGSFHATRRITVLEEMNPELILEGSAVTMLLGEDFTEPGFSAKAEDGTDLTGRVKVSSRKFKRAGEHEVTYTVEDDQGRATRLVRTVYVLPNTQRETAGLPICMYHYVYDENDPPEDLNRRYGNYISAQALTEEIRWLKSEDYYFPTWKEVRAYADGELILPEKSIVLTFDDGEKATLEMLIPLLEECQVPVTSFLITSKKGESKVVEYTSEYLIYQSHTHDMHKSGGVAGHRGLFPVIGEEEGMVDLEKSIEICGSRDAFAYPYGDYSDSAIAMLKEAGFLCAVTTQPGRVFPGDDPYLLPRQRMSLGQSMETFRQKVAPPEEEL